MCYSKPCQYLGVIESAYREKKTYEVLRDGDFHWLVGEAEYGNELAHAIRSVVEEEQCIIIYIARKQSIINSSTTQRGEKM